MHNKELLEQAESVADLMPRIVGRLFELCEDDPAHELPVGQLRVCGLLRTGPKSMSTLSRELGVSLSAATQIADRLEKSGFVERTCEHSDRRVKCLRLTSLGEQMMSARRDRRVVRVAKALASVSPESRDEIVAALSALLNAASTLSSD